MTSCTDLVHDHHDTQNKNLIFIRKLKAKSRGFTKQTRNKGHDPAKVVYYGTINTGNIIGAFSFFSIKPTPAPHRLLRAFLNRAVNARGGKHEQSI